MATCKSCGAEIIWIETVNGKKMPCDPEQVVYTAQKGGPLKIVTPNGEVLSARQEIGSPLTTGVGYISHFSTCPYANQHRKKG